MALPVPNTALAKKKKDPLDDLVDTRMTMTPAKSETAVDAVGKPVAAAARAGTIPKTQQMPSGPQTATFSSGKAEPLDELAAQRAAAAAELDADKAKALQGASARAGAGGFGLSGGTSAMLSDIGRQQDRTKALTMADFDKMAEDRAFTDIQRDAALADYEDAFNADINGDGRIGGFTNATTGEVEGGTVAQGANQSNAEYVAAQLQDNAAQEAKRYPDAEIRDITVAEARDINGYPVAADSAYLYFKDAGTGVVFKVKRTQQKA